MKKFKFKYDDIFNQVISMSFNPKLQNSILYEEDTLPNNYGVIKAREALDKVHNGEKEYKPEFIKEMAEIREEKPVRVSGYDDLFDDE